MNISILEHFLVVHCQNDLAKCRSVLGRICEGQESLRMIAPDVGMSESQLSRKREEFTECVRTIRPEIEVFLDAIEEIRKPVKCENVLPFRRA